MWAWLAKLFGGSAGGAAAGSAAGEVAAGSLAAETAGGAAVETAGASAGEMLSTTMMEGYGTEAGANIFGQEAAGVELAPSEGIGPEGMGIDEIGPEGVGPEAMIDEIGPNAPDPGGDVGAQSSAPDMDTSTGLGKLKDGILDTGKNIATGPGSEVQKGLDNMGDARDAKTEGNTPDKAKNWKDTYDDFKETHKKAKEVQDKYDRKRRDKNQQFGYGVQR